MMNKDAAYKTIEELVERFGEQILSYKKSDYNETLTRKDFIDPFFKALGWDMDNSQGNAEAYREVIHEDKVKVGAATKAPDYSFKLAGGKRLFFVEAKKPSVVVKDEVLPAYQIRRYAWSAKLPISILTDFEEFAIYDCNKKPTATDKSSVGRIKYLTYKDYLKEFDFIWNTFSKERVLKGSFDQFIAADKHKKGTATVDKEFLISLDEWRKQLALNIALRNETLTEDELNFVVQQTLDRLIFLRIAEDRGVEEYGRLKALLSSPTGGGQEGAYYNNLFTYFKEADSKYNSGLFDFKKDTISRNTVIDNKTIKGIINELYYPISPYEFSVLSVEILGSAYEQFLGKQIKLSAGHRATIEEKPEVRKAGGVYYTPQYIVEYIVENTLGKLAPLNTTEGAKQITPGAVSKLKIVDPACGSGSFLLGAYQYLLNWHLQYYKPEFEKLTAIAQNSKEYNEKQRNDALKERNKLPLTPTGNLTTALKKQILLNNIYGVDIDTQAVEVTKLSLLLKCMEGETGSSITAEMRFGERILPTLDSNIKSGNSLVDMDFYEGQIDFTPELEKKVKPFSWKKGFTDVFKQGGFDCVIGNPPYGAILSKEEIDYFRNSYRVANYQLDTYILFFEKGNNLLKQNGKLGFIVPTAWTASIYDVKFREYLTTSVSINKIVVAPKQTFKDATVETGIIIISKDKTTNEFWVERWDTAAKETYTISVLEIINTENKNFHIYTNPLSKKLINKIREKKRKLSDLAKVSWGIKPYQKGKGIPPQKGFESENKIYHSNEKLKDTHKPLIGGSEVCRYNLKWSKGFIDYGKWLAEPRNPDWFLGPRILVREVVAKGIIQATIVEGDYVFSNSVDGIKLVSKEIDLKFLLGVINSKVISFFHSNTSPNAFKGTFPKVLLQDLRDLPIPDTTTKKQQSLHDEIVQLVETMLQLQQQKQSSTLPGQLQQLEQRIAYTDDKINEKVYTLYGLSEEEVRIVEGR